MFPVCVLEYPPVNVYDTISLPYDPDAPLAVSVTPLWFWTYMPQELGTLPFILVADRLLIVGTTLAGTSSVKLKEVDP